MSGPMLTVNLKSLIDKLNDTCRTTLESAAGLCLSRTNYNVEVEHWLSRLIEVPDADLFGWISGEAATPDNYDSALFRRLKAFHTHDAPIHS